MQSCPPGCRDARMPDCPVMSAVRQFPCLPRAAFLARFSTNQSKDVVEPPIPLRRQMVVYTAIIPPKEMEYKYEPISILFYRKAQLNEALRLCILKLARHNPQLFQRWHCTFDPHLHI
ncbi:BG:DS01514.3 [Drosophila simulans]|uniref:BG:DS01514.3 n=1 Tax=Drosophila simulans TaxID=7240 RepID=B4Q5G4_DROSI|nr:BG:DS01514.3 [Drosophila simulans]